jgi:hypothetical protein
MRLGLPTPPTLHPQVTQLGQLAALWEGDWQKLRAFLTPQTWQSAGAPAHPGILPALPQRSLTIQGPLSFGALSELPHGGEGIGL